MKRAAVAQLKASLSRYLAAVKVGEEVVVTERGKPIAKLVPLTGSEDTEGKRLRRLEAQGLLRLGSGQLPKGFWDAPRPKDPAGLLRQTLVEERRQSR